MLIDYEKGLRRFISVKHLSNANVLVISHMWFSISLLDFGSPFMGHHFRVKMVCNIHGRSLGGLEANGPFCCYFFLFFYFYFCITCKSSQGLILYKELELFFCCIQVLTWKVVNT